MQIRVMVVDDEPIAAQSITMLVKKIDTKIEVVGSCYSGREAINMAASLRPDIVIMDIQMPGINGLEAMRKIREINPNIRFVVLSAYNEFSYAVEAMSIGADDYLLKPMKKAQFVATVQKVVADVLARSEKMDIELQFRERVQIIEPMIKKDFIRALLPNAGADESLIACGEFLGVAKQTACMAVFSYKGNKAGQSIMTIFDWLSPQVIVDRYCEDKTLAFIPVPEGASAQRNIMDIQQMIDNQLIEHNIDARAGIGDIAKGTINMKRSVAQAMSALSCTTEKKRCLIFDQTTMSIAQNEYVIEPREPLTTKEIVERATRYIQENYMQELTLDDVASKTNLSPYYFCRLFKEVVGENYSDYLLNKRIEHAKELLANTSVSIKTIGTQVGFKEPSYFSKVFHKATGMKASDFRASYKNTDTTG